MTEQTHTSMSPVEEAYNAYKLFKGFIKPLRLGNDGEDPIPAKWVISALIDDHAHEDIMGALSIVDCHDKNVELPIKD